MTRRWRPSTGYIYLSIYTLSTYLSTLYLLFSLHSIYLSTLYILIYLLYIYYVPQLNSLYLFINFSIVSPYLSIVSIFTKIILNIYSTGSTQLTTWMSAPTRTRSTSRISRRTRGGETTSSTSTRIVLQKFNPKFRNHGEGPY